MGRGDAGVLVGPTYDAGLAQLPGRLPSSALQRFARPIDEHAFAHPAERDLARILSFYRIRWVYEPTTFHLEFRDDGRPAEQITPDFYLPDHDLFIELTTMRQRLVTRKNRKIRRLREAFPSVHIKLLYRKDYDRLIGAYPSPDHIQDPVIGDVVLEAGELDRRIGELADEIQAAVEPGSAGRASSGSLHLIGVGTGARQFLSGLSSALDQRACSVVTDQLFLSRFGGEPNDERIRFGHALKAPVAGREVVLVADIVSSGLSLVSVTDWLRSKGARRVWICALLDRADARIIDIPLDFVGFRAPDEVLVGFGLSSYPQFRDFPYIASIHESDC